MKIKSFQKYIILSLIIVGLFSCNNELSVKSANFYDNNSTQIGFTKHSVKVNDQISVCKYSGGINQSKIKKITKFLYCIEINSKKFWISETNYRTLLKDLNILIQNKDNFRFQINSQWVEWHNFNNISSNTKYMSLDPNVNHPNFNIPLNKRTDTEIRIPNHSTISKNKSSQKNDPYKIIPGKGLNTNSFRIAQDMISTADVGLRAELSLLNYEYQKYTHNPYWVMKLIPQTHFAQVNLQRINNETIQLNNFKLDESIVTDIALGLLLLNKYK